MKYLEGSFSVAVGQHQMSDAEYALRVGNITQDEFDQLLTKDVLYDKESKAC
jgi:hypothetical protein